MHNGNSGLQINSIGDLQIALIEDDNQAIKGYIERLDRETANLAMTQAGVHFGFPTVEIEGVVRTSAGHLGRVFGYTRPDSLVKLLDRRGVVGPSVGGFRHNGGIIKAIHETLKLDPSDYKSILYDWPAFLIGGMNSTNEEAQVVQSYLLRMEKVARVGIVSVKRGEIVANFPDPSHGIVMAKLAKEAWRGSPIAAYILEKYYDVPVRQLLHQTDPELSEDAGRISQYLHLVYDDQYMTHGIKITKTAAGYILRGTTVQFYATFLDMARRHHLPQFFTSTYNLGIYLAREADALEILGWTRTYHRSQGDRIYCYEYKPKEDPIETPKA